MNDFFKEKTGGTKNKPEQQKFVNLNDSNDLEGHTVNLQDKNAGAPTLQQSAN